MSEKKIIAVVGGTGAQGGGLVQAILADEDGNFVARVLTRNAESEKAKSLAGLGVEVVAADLDNVDDLLRAFSGTYGAYCVTSFWEHFSAEKEIQQARNMAEAAKRAGVKHVVWSTLEDTRQWVPLSDDRMPTLQGEYKVPHFDAKGAANASFTELGVPTTFLYTSFYWDNFIFFDMGPKKGPDGRLAITLPMADKKMPGIASQDIGRCAYGIFKKGPETIGTSIGISGGHLTGDQMADALGRALGEEIAYNAVSHDTYRGFGFPGADDLGNMFQFKCDFEGDYCAARDVEATRSLNPALLSFDDWLARNKDQIPVG